MIILMYIYFFASYLHAYITFNLRAVTSFKTALGDSMSKCFERRSTKCILHSWPRGHGLFVDFRLPSSRTDTVCQHPEPCPSRNFTRTCPWLLRLSANESNAAIFCSGKAGWARPIIFERVHYLVKFNCYFSWQVHYFVKFRCHFSWQAHY